FNLKIGIFLYSSLFCNFFDYAISALRFLILTVLFKLALGILPGHNHYVSIKMTWSEARTYCREHYTDLSSINNQEDEDSLLQLSSLVDSDSGEDDALLQQDSWIGLYSDDHDTWKWSGGTNASFFNWTKGNDTAANKKCVVFSKSGWLKKNCENKFTFFCFHNNLSYRYIYGFTNKWIMLF
uniref:C-type lectin domain-containing protein n=1 Tax=Oreochromis aureus TaxID=47969 RepID=A0A668RG49_OREAU